ncbi:MFS transporter [Streptomyces sp. T028]|uniref:MFS transporter n=1 Tax=Streptomyces sp. T028 TaxID=3394379 RepID=UPI003A8B7FA0
MFLRDVSQSPSCPGAERREPSVLVTRPSGRWSVRSRDLAEEGARRRLGAERACDSLSRYGYASLIWLVSLLVFAGGSVAGSLVDETSLVIAARAVMGVGAAVVMPATLSLLVAMFPRRERARAVTAWTATSGLAIAVGPLVADWPLEDHAWGSTFLINVPIAVVAVPSAPSPWCRRRRRRAWAGSTTSADCCRSSRSAPWCTPRSRARTSAGAPARSPRPWSPRWAWWPSSSGSCATRTPCWTCASSPGGRSAGRCARCCSSSSAPSARSITPPSSCGSSSATTRWRPAYGCCRWPVWPSAARASSCSLGSRPAPRTPTSCPRCCSASRSG